MRNLFIFIFLFFHFFGQAQSVKPFILNMGGGSGSSPTMQSSWSIGESSVIGTFSNSFVQFNAGVLQPNIDVVTSIQPIGSVIFGDQIIISPNPSYGNIQVHFKMKVPGKAIMSLYNSASKLVKTISLNEIFSSQIQVYKLNELATGSYFLKIQYQAFNGHIQEGVYKIIRL